MKIETVPPLPPPTAENLIEGREFGLYKVLDKVPQGQKTLYLIRRLARAEAALEIIPQWDLSREGEWQEAWKAWEKAKGGGGEGGK